MPDIGPYRILSLIAESTQAVSYRAVHTRLDREVFLKVLPGGGPGMQERRRRFEREAKALAKIDHPAVVRIWDFGEAEGLLFLASEYVDGPDLARRIAQGPIPWEELRQISLQLLDGLQALHEAGIVHRDIKPSNIMLSGNGPKLADLGLARVAQSPSATQSDTLIGTPAYMDPALLKGSPAGEQSDLFSLGATLMEALTGRRPFPGETFQEVIRSLVETDPPAALPPDTPEEARRLLTALLRKEPERRPASAAEARRMLEAPPPGRMRNPHLRNRMAGGAAALVLATLVVAVALPALRERSHRSPDEAIARDETSPGWTVPDAPRGQPGGTTRSDPVVPAVLPDSQPRLPGSAPVAAARTLPSGAESAPTTGTLWIAASPWSEVRIDGTPRDTTPLTAPFELPAGRHTVTLSHPAYPPVSSTVSIVAGKEESLLVSLADSVGFLMVHTDPWADLFVDEERIGTTPLAGPVALRPGRHAVRAENPFFPATTADVDVARSETTVVRVALREPER